MEWMSFMFRECSWLQSLDVRGFDMSKVVKKEDIFLIVKVCLGCK